MVFELRPGTSAPDLHANLCMDVLQTFIDACRAQKLASFWDLAIKVPNE